MAEKSNEKPTGVNLPASRLASRPPSEYSPHGALRRSVLGEEPTGQNGEQEEASTTPDIRPILSNYADFKLEDQVTIETIEKRRQSVARQRYAQAQKNYLDVETLLKEIAEDSEKVTEKVIGAFNDYVENNGTEKVDVWTYRAGFKDIIDGPSLLAEKLSPIGWHPKCKLLDGAETEGGKFTHLIEIPMP